MWWHAPLARANVARANHRARASWRKFPPPVPHPPSPMFVFFDGVGLARGAAGGVAIAFASSLSLFLTGRVAGMSGIIGPLASGRAPPLFETAYVAGLLSAGALLLAVSPREAVFGAPDGPALHWGAAAVGGVAVGLGARLGSGCTSGHGIIGLARLSPRSLAAVAAFFATGIVTAGVSRSAALRVALYGAAAALPAPTGAYGWTLSPGLYIVPLLVAAAAGAALLAAARARAAAAAARPRDAPAAPAAEAAAEAPPPASPVASEGAPPAAPAASAALLAAPGAAGGAPSRAALAAAAGGVWATGVAFGLALGLSGMLDPAKVLRFLDFLGDGGCAFPPRALPRALAPRPQVRR
jgi:uncharacterized membrane protein YedE/YeeE